MLVAKQAGSFFCLVLFLFLQLLAASPELHRYVHHDASQADHQCAVTLLSQGNVVHAPTATPIVFVPSQMIEIPARALPAFVSVDHLLPPGRGPPASILG